MPTPIPAVASIVVSWSEAVEFSGVHVGFYDHLDFSCQSVLAASQLVHAHCCGRYEHGVKSSITVRQSISASYFARTAGRGRPPRSQMLEASGRPSTGCASNARMATLTWCGAICTTRFGVTRPRDRRGRRRVWARRPRSGTGSPPGAGVPRHGRRRWRCFRSRTAGAPGRRTGVERCLALLSRPRAARRGASPGSGRQLSVERLAEEVGE